MLDSRSQTDYLLSGLETCDPTYRPTNFWAPGVRDLSAALLKQGLETFKSWPQASTWFYPVYGSGFTNDTIKKTFAHARSVNPRAREAWTASALNGALEARRDFDAARLAWDQERWPFDLEGHGESRVGRPPQRYRMTGTDEVGWGRPYLNYLLCLAALSKHVTKEPTSFLELGGGFGALGEIVLSRNSTARYVNLDLPPLLTVAAYYLIELFGQDQVMLPTEAPEHGPIQVAGSACLPNWRLPDVVGPFDVFMNSYSFQEMEPDVVDHYIRTVSDVGVQYAVSYNSVHGKPRNVAGAEGGVLNPVTSAKIIEMFQSHGYRLLSTYRDPLVVSAAEIAVLERS
jgi:putative sugar O-methyltransferase